MLQVFYGNDTIKVRQAAFTFVEPLEDKGATVELIDSDTWQSGMLRDAAGATSLFGGETVYLIDTPSSSADFNTECIDVLEVLATSSTQFVVIEGALLAAAKKQWAKHAAEMTEYKAAAGERFNSFAIADALAKKDKKSLWLIYQEAVAAGQSAEELIGILWWQLKSLRLAKLTSSASEAGMKDFPYNKAKRALSTFKDGELESLSLSLLTLYHDGHGGVVDINEGLERWLLKL